MIVYRCLKCSMKSHSVVPICPICCGINFVSEYCSESEAQLLVPDFVNESIESNSETKNQFLVNSSNLPDQNDSTSEGFTFSHKDSNECEKTYFESHGIVNEGSTFASNPNIQLKIKPAENACPNPFGHEYEKTYFESHGNSGSTIACKPDIHLKGGPSENFCPNNAGYDNEKTFFENHGIVNSGSTFTCNQDTYLKGETSEKFRPNNVGYDYEERSFGSHETINAGLPFACNQDIYLKGETLENFRPNNVGYDYEKTSFGSHGIANAGSTFTYCPNINFKEDKSQIFSQNPFGNKTIRPEPRNSTTFGYSLNGKNNYNSCHSNFNFHRDPQCPSTSERQHLINVSHDMPRTEYQHLINVPYDPSKTECQQLINDPHDLPRTECQHLINDPHDLPMTECQHLISVPHDLPRTECKSQLSVEMRTEMQTIAKSSGTPNTDGSAYFSHFSAKKVKSNAMKQSCPDSVTAQNSFMDSRNESGSSCLDLLSKRRCYSSQNFCFEGFKSMHVVPKKAQSSEQQTKAAPESGFSKDPYNFVSTSLQCQKCLKRFRKQSILNVHKQNNCDPKPFKCDKCPMKFKNEGNLIIHQSIHSFEKPFKCKICSFATRWESSIKQHIKQRHGNYPY